MNLCEIASRVYNLLFSKPVNDAIKQKTAVLCEKIKNIKNARYLSECRSNAVILFSKDKKDA